MSEPLGHQIPVQPTGEHATIETASQLTVLQALGCTEPEARARCLRDVLLAPASFSPPVLYAVAAALFDDGHREQGAFWYFVAQLRTRFDINRCADPTVEDVAVLLRQHGRAINQWVFADLSLVRRLVERAVAWDRSAGYDYDHRWVNLHGMGAFGVSDSPLSRPAAEWAVLAEQTRATYLAELDEALGT